MSSCQSPEIDERDLVGFKYFKKLLPLLDRLHHAGTQRDRAGNRQLHFDQYTALILLYFFNPILTSLRGIQQASALQKVQRQLRCQRAALGSLSEASRVFDSDLLRGIINELADQLQPIPHDPRLDQIQGILTLVDGTLLKALPRLTEAMWQSDKSKAFKLHTHFELLKGVPVHMDLTDANTSELAVLSKALLPDRVYVKDRGYAAFWLFDQIEAAGSSYVCRIRDNSVYEVKQAFELSHDAKLSNVMSDQLVLMNKGKIKLRLVQIQCTPHRKSVKTGRGGPQQGDVLLVATNLWDVPAEVIALIYQRRWAIEIFFRFFKHVLGCRHLLSHSRNGIEIQTYMAIIASMLIALWTGRKPTLRTYEMICFYFTGLATETELTAHMQKLKKQDG